MAASADPLREEITRPDRAAQDRQLAQDLRRARDHVATMAGVARPVDYELVRTYSRNGLKGWPYQILLTAALAAMSLAWAPAAGVLPGALLVAAALAVLGLAWRRLLRMRPVDVFPKTWRAGFMMGELVQGTGWILVAIPFLAGPAGSTGGANGSTFLLLSILVHTGVAAILRSPVPKAAWAAIGPQAVILLLVAARMSGPEPMALAGLVLSGQVFLVYVARRLHRTAVATFRTRAEMRASLAELERIRASTDAVQRRAAEAERTKTQFFATMSHELRTPLNAILGFSEVMKNEVLGSHSTPSYREYSNDIYGSGQHLLALINEILDLSRIEAGQYVLKEEPTRLEDLVRECAAALAPRAEAKSQTIQVEVARDLEPIRVDPAALRQILMNLLSNAVKFTGPEGRIAVRAGWTSRGGQYVSVKDDGPGIPPDEIPVALSSFGRGSLAVSTAEQGVGLGLPIARGLAELHGGRLTLTSVLRKGTEAAVILPASRCAAARGSGPSKVSAAAA